MARRAWAFAGLLAGTFLLAGGCAGSDGAATNAAAGGPAGEAGRAGAGNAGGSGALGGGAAGIGAAGSGVAGNGGAHDAGFDVDTDSSANSDSGLDASLDASSDAAGTDASLDASVDASLDAGVDASTGIVFSCPGCLIFPPPGATECTPATLGPATLAYPLDGTLFPANLGNLELQFVPPGGATVFEIDFANAITDVRVETQCNPITPVRASASSGCGVSLSEAEWSAIADGNRDGDPVRITVRATIDGSCVSVSTAKIAVSFAKEDLSGALYYWQSSVNQKVDGRTGGIYAHDFGALATSVTPVYEPDANGTCTGCHAPSRDGARMALVFDDADGDDEYGDAMQSVLDVASRTVVGGKAVSLGVQTFTHDHSLMIASMFKTTAANKSFGIFDDNGKTLLASPTFPGFLVAQPDLSADDASLVFVSPAFGQISSAGDHHFFGGSLYVAAFNASAKTLAPSTAVLQSSGTGQGASNYYYPSFSPDGAFVLFDHAPSGDAFHNPNARIQLVHMPPVANAQPIDLPALNVANGLTNSWPRWSTSVQTYKGHKLLWVTFSSTRDYGLRLLNQGLPNCYPPESPTYDQPQPLSVSNGDYTSCTQPQLWMAAVIVDPDTSLDAADRSFPAFWLPFQDVTHHNHTAQWTSQIPAAPARDAGACGETGATCGAASALCCTDRVCCSGLCQASCSQ